MQQDDRLRVRVLHGDRCQDCVKGWCGAGCGYVMDNELTTANTQKQLRPLIVTIPLFRDIPPRTLRKTRSLHRSEVANDTPVIPSATSAHHASHIQYAPVSRAHGRHQQHAPCPWSATLTLDIGVADSEPPSSGILDQERALLWQGQHWYV